LADPRQHESQFAEAPYWHDAIIPFTCREYNGLIETPCAARGGLCCLSCHSMHSSQPHDQLAAGMDGNRACLQCHERFAGKIPEHTHHAPNSSGSLCYNCHMPLATYGLLKAVRNHYIDSPSVKVTAQVGRPNA